jgi:uncharacterized protein YecE (DUF72 family)
MPVSLGTCSWMYHSWEGIVYPEEGGKYNYLKEYSRHFNTVEVDQWFWSLFGVDKVKLPDAKTVEEWSRSVPRDFKFTVKVPNCITLTHFYTHGKPNAAPMEVNPYFLSMDLFNEFLKRIEPLREYVEVLMFQFEYLNRQKMASQGDFLERFGAFIKSCPSGYRYAVESRNPNYFNERYFEFLEVRGLGHVFVQGYYMPSVKEVFGRYSRYFNHLTVIRLIGSDRQGIEKRAGNKWGVIVDPRDGELRDIVAVVKALEARGVKVFVNVNNHYEGSAPLTIKKLRELLSV